MTEQKENYVPTNEESFMNSNQKSYFRHRLRQWKDTLLTERVRVHSIESGAEADVADSASKETDNNIELATRQRESLLIEKINLALQKIEEGTYGFCEETGEPIDIHRLIARPIATLSLEAQERKEKIHRSQIRRSV
jgi:DnaK suppressor protein